MTRYVDMSDGVIVVSRVGVVSRSAEVQRHRRGDDVMPPRDRRAVLG